MPKNLQAEWARLLIGSFADAGVTDVVISPGSRSTPFVLAAARHPSLRCFDLIDERTAAFFALGQARVTGRPVLLLPTSGTAGANYLPAVVEAGASHTPLLVLTADRPVELTACGANQTIDQLKLYGDHARAFFDLGAPEDSPRALRALRRVAAQAVFTSRYPRPGAVHLNARARKPLEPSEAVSDGERALAEAVSELLARPVPNPRAPSRLPAADDVDELARACGRTERGLIICGPASLAQASTRSLIGELGRRTGFPVLREAASQVRYCPELDDDVLAVDGFDLLLGSDDFRAGASPELILQIGRCPTSGRWGRYLAEQFGSGDGACSHWVLGADSWQDAESTASHLLFADLDGCLARLTTRLKPRGGPSEWAQRWRRGEETVRRAIEEELDSLDELSEGGVARALVAALPAGSLLAVGNSLSIREVDTFCPSSEVDLRVWCQRGASGIDGLTSGVLGAATAWRHRVGLLIGDLSFLYDLSGLHAARYVTVPTLIVVLQNHGGRIFEQLPLSAHPAATDEVFEHWTTPHELDLAPAAALHGIPHERVERLTELESALEAALDRPGVSVIEAVVPPHGAAEQNRRLRQRVDRALAGGGA